MLRSVVSEMAANMMLVQMQFRCAHLIGVLNVGRQQSGARHHRNHVPRRTSKACDYAGMGCDRNSSGGMERCGVRPEVCIIDPHPVEDHAHTPGQSNHGALGTTTASDLRSPCSQPCRTPTVHHHGCGLTQRAAQVDIAGLSNAARDVAFTGLVARWCHADPWPDLLGRREPGRIIDGGSVAERDNRADARHRH